MYTNKQYRMVDILSKIFLGNYHNFYLLENCNKLLERISGVENIIYFYTSNKFHTNQMLNDKKVFRLYGILNTVTNLKAVYFFISFFGNSCKHVIKTHLPLLSLKIMERAVENSILRQAFTVINEYWNVNVILCVPITTTNDISLCFSVWLISSAES